jgi:hypothetical protein
MLVLPPWRGGPDAKESVHGGADHRGITYFVEQIEGADDRLLKVVYVIRGPRGGS